MKVGQNPTTKALYVLLPKAIAEAMDIKKGDDLKFKVAGKNRLELVKE